jgi:hypothetical protein
MSGVDIAALRLADPDAAFRLLVEAHRGLSEAESAALNARLVLVLMNAAGDMAVIEEAFRLARLAGEPSDAAHSPQIDGVPTARR